jgi:hypothetical protein
MRGSGYTYHLLPPSFIPVVLRQGTRQFTLLDTEFASSSKKGSHGSSFMLRYRAHIHRAAGAGAFLFQGGGGIFFCLPFVHEYTGGEAPPHPRFLRECTGGEALLPSSFVNALGVRTPSCKTSALSLSLTHTKNEVPRCILYIKTPWCFWNPLLRSARNRNCNGQQDHRTKRKTRGSKKMGGYLSCRSANSGQALLSVERKQSHQMRDRQSRGRNRLTIRRALARA